MERLKKKIKCESLKKDVSATYFVEAINNSDGSLKKKSVQYFNCEGQEECTDKINIINCTCFKEIRRIEMEINVMPVNK